MCVSNFPPALIFCKSNMAVEANNACASAIFRHHLFFVKPTWRSRRGTHKCHAQKITTPKKLPRPKNCHAQKIATPKKLPRPKNCHAQKIATPKKLPRPKNCHAQKIATPKKLPRPKNCHAQRKSFFS